MRATILLVYTLAAVQGFLQAPLSALIGDNSLQHVRVRGGAATATAPLSMSSSSSSSSSGGAHPKDDPRSAVRKAGGKYMRALEEKPLQTKMITSGIICGAGDVLAQAIAVGGLGALKGAFELKRCIIYGSIGGFYLAPLIHYWFSVLEKLTSRREMRDVTKGKPVIEESKNSAWGQRLKKAGKMVFLDQAVASPFLNGGFLFVFAVVSSLLSGYGIGTATNTGIDKIQTALWPTLLASWKIWPAANFINFLFIPAPLRVLFLNGVGLGWNVIMSAAATS